MEQESLLAKDSEFEQINQLYDECLNYLQAYKDVQQTKTARLSIEDKIFDDDPGYEIIKEKFNKVQPDLGIYEELIEIKQSDNNKDSKEIQNSEDILVEATTIVEVKEFKQLKNNPNSNDTLKLKDNIVEAKNNIAKLSNFKVENEIVDDCAPKSVKETKSQRLRRFSKQLPKIIITNSNSNVEGDLERIKLGGKFQVPKTAKKKTVSGNASRSPSLHRMRPGSGDFPKRLVSKSGLENVALISNVPFERLRLLNDTFHTLINLRWRWIVVGTVVVHFAIWLVFAVFWYITALAHYDFAPDPPRRACVTGGKDFVTIFLASVEAQTTIGFGDRAIDEECPESIFLFIMQLILGTGLSGVLTCVVYAKLTRPEKLSRDGVGFSKKAVISIRDGHLCLMARVWDLNHDHIISSEFSAHFIHTYKTKEGEVIRYFARAMPLQTRQFLLWPVTLVHIIDEVSPLYRYSPIQLANSSFEITISLKGASASMGTFTQSQTSYTPREIIWGHRFPPVVKYDSRKQKYVIEHKKLNATEPVDTPYCSASELQRTPEEPQEAQLRVSTPSSFGEKISGFVLERTSSFRKVAGKT